MICRSALVILCALLGVQADDSPIPTGPGPRIVGGYKVAERSQFPYQVSIRLQSRHFCGGTILDEQHVLTAAHCCYDKENNLLPAKSLTVVVGDLNLKKPTSSTVEKKVKYVFPHSSYNPKSIANDIAVFRIQGTFGNWNSAMKPLALSQSLPPPLTSCRVSGWGTLKYEDDNIPSDLYAANVYIFDDDFCKNAYRNKIKSGMFCAGHIQGGIDSCQGDSGGPLERNNILVGVVSWGYECAKPGAPGVYTDVSIYLDWISKQQKRSSSTIHVISTLTIITAMILHLLRFA